MTDFASRQLVLIVDDTPDNIDVLANILKADYEIKAAINGERAIRIAQTEPKPDIILLDIMMPGIDGYEVCRQLKANPETADIPVIFITARDDEADEKRGLELGAVDYIAKPISPPLVIARVRNHLLMKKQQDQLKQSISVLEHEAEILEQKAELGLQAGGLAHDINNVMAVAMAIQLLPEMVPDDAPEREDIDELV